MVLSKSPKKLILILLICRKRWRIKICKKTIDKQKRMWYNSNVLEREQNRIYAGVAQWQSSWFVISRLLVRLRSPAPGGIPERPKGADCKSVVTDFGGPNPPSPTKDLDFLRSWGFYFFKLVLCEFDVLCKIRASASPPLRGGWQR